ncbi:histidine phosphatase family protein [Pseudomonas sp.]|uniref:lipopolysaccharide core heptose(II)-phosphate phosphatase PmrG n=1 Tax=Pseudomonas sp. TaxID=306 RepID=UPI003CC5EDCA
MPVRSAVQTLPLRWFTLRRRVIATGLVAAAVAAWALHPTGAVDLADGKAMRHSGLKAAWQAGNVAVLVRHGERCDRSNNACLGDADGITLAGSRVASNVGDGLQALGMGNAQVLTSPLTRTQQTAMFMFGAAATPQDWLMNCRKTMLKDVVAHKQPGHNMVLVTHSECMNALEQQAGIHGGDGPGYASALFVSIDPVTGTPKVLGDLNASEWPRLLRHFKG